MIVGVVSARYNSADGWFRDSVWVAWIEDLQPLLGQVPGWDAPALMEAPRLTGTVLSRRRVVAVVATLLNGLEQVGSGYLIDDSRVLTAEHCIRDKATGAAPVSLSVVRSFDGERATQVKVSASSSSGEPSGLDVAVLHLDDPPWAEGLRPPVFAAVNRDQPGELRDCVCIGYPLFQFDAESGVRKTAEMHGLIRQTDEAEIGQEIGQLLFRDPTLTDVGVPAGVAHRENLTAWGGLSGALVFYRDQAIGIVIEHRPHQGGSAVRLMAFDQLLRRAATNAHAAQLAAELGLSPNRPPVVVSAGPELVEEELTICGGDGCANCFPDEAGWEGRCPECMALWDDHAVGHHDPPVDDACSAAERVFSERVLACVRPTGARRV